MRTLYETMTSMPESPSEDQIINLCDRFCHTFDTANRWTVFCNIEAAALGLLCILEVSIFLL